MIIHTGFFGAIIALKVLLALFDAFASIPLLMLSLMAFDAPGSEKHWLTYVPMTFSIILGLASLWFFVCVW